MKRIAIAVCVVVLILAVAIIAQTQGQPKSGSAEQELLKLEQEWTNALVKADWAFLNRILADDWVITDIDGSVTTKAQDLASLKSGELVISSMVADDMKARVYGDAAVVTGRNTLKGTDKGKDVSGQERWTDTWIKKAGLWQCVATHASTIAQK
ncbi:MAG: nuclear transport factor 2 family protein [Candidatus Aminicenantales bacterium]|jgi:ketosteroid isomerase-like protein